MKTDRATEDLLEKLKTAGYLMKIVPAARLADVQAEYAGLLSRGTLDRDFYDARLAHYDFRLPADFPQAKSIILTAVRQPRIRVGFVSAGRKHSFVIPPTYDYRTDAAALEIIRTCLERYGYTMRDAVFPWKALAVQSGLASYGKNNLAYVEGWGSLVRLRGFLSDVPAPEDTWRSPTVMKCCCECTACLRACPSGAIADDRFVIHAERCLTYFNEEPADFPKWVDPGWHACLVGCMVCQDICPANRAYADYEAGSVDFSEEETSMLLEGTAFERLPGQTAGKLEASTLALAYDTLPRNLRALLKRGSSTEA